MSLLSRNALKVKIFAVEGGGRRHLAEEGLLESCTLPEQALIKCLGLWVAVAEDMDGGRLQLPTMGLWIHEIGVIGARVHAEASWLARLPGKTLARRSRCDKRPSPANDDLLHSCEAGMWYDFFHLLWEILSTFAQTKIPRW